MQKSNVDFLDIGIGVCVLLFVFSIAAPESLPKIGTKKQQRVATEKIVALRRAIIGQESNNNFKAVNPHSGALGYAQVMPDNLIGEKRGWDYEALGRDVSTDEFLNDPDLQLKIINHKMGNYLEGALKNTNGDEEKAVRRVASAWYSGQGDLYDNTNPQYYNGGAYPSIRDYTLSVLDKFKQEKHGVNRDDLLRENIKLCQSQGLKGSEAMQCAQQKTDK